MFQGRVVVSVCDYWGFRKMSLLFYFVSSVFLICGLPISCNFSSSLPINSLALAGAILVPIVAPLDL